MNVSTNLEVLTQLTIVWLAVVAGVLAIEFSQRVPQWAKTWRFCAAMFAVIAGLSIARLVTL